MRRQIMMQRQTIVIQQRLLHDMSKAQMQPQLQLQQMQMELAQHSLMQVSISTRILG